MNHRKFTQRGIRMLSFVALLVSLASSANEKAEPRNLMRSLTQEAYDHLVIQDPNRRIFGMAYEFKAMPDGPQFQAFGLDSMHDGSWLMSALATANRIDPQGGYLDLAQRTSVPFYINVLKNSDLLFPKMQPREGQEKFTKPVKGWAPRGWDDGLGVDLVPFMRGEATLFSTGINSHPSDSVVELDGAGNFVQSYHTSSHHLFQDLADALLNVWLTTRDPAAAEAVQLIHQTRLDIGHTVPVVQTAARLISEDKTLKSNQFEFDPAKAFEPIWRGYVEKKPYRINHYNDGLSWKIRDEIARAARDENGALDPIFVNQTIAHLYSRALLAKAFHRENWQPGITLGAGSIEFKDGELLRHGDENTLIYSRGVQLPWLAAAVLPAFRENAESWNATVAKIDPDALELLKSGLAKSGVDLNLSHENVLADLEAWIDGTIEFWSAIRDEKGFLPRMVKVNGQPATWSGHMELGVYAHFIKLAAFRLMDLEDTTEIALIREQVPRKPQPHTPLPDSVLEIQGLKKANAKNLIKNPSFELDADDNERPDDWQQADDEALVFLDRALPMNGHTQVTVTFNKTGEQRLTQNVKLKPDTEYTLGCWIRGRAAKGNAWARFRELGDDEKIWETKRAHQGHSDWTLYQTTFTTSKNHAEGQFEIAWQLTDQGIFRFDFASLIEGRLPATPPNTPPRLRSDRFDVQRGAAFGSAEPGLLKNDEDAENDALEIVDFSQPKNGSVTIEKNGAFVYRPNDGFAGEDSFDYEAEDENGARSKSKVVLTVADFPKPKNLLKNGDFETDLSHWKIGSYPFGRDDSVSRSGSAAIRVEARPTPHFARQENLPFRPEKRYRLSAWIKGENLEGGGISLAYAHPDGRRHWGTAGLTGTFDWRKVVVDFGSAREPVDGGSVDVLARFTSGTAWVDDVVIEERPLPVRVFIDGHSVTGGVVPILKELGRDAVKRGLFDREISIRRSPHTDEQIYKNGAPFDFAFVCSWSSPQYNEDLDAEIARKEKWKTFFAEQEPAPEMILYQWQPWGSHHWPDGFKKLDRDFRGVAETVGIRIAPCTLAFTKYVEQSDDPQAALRQLYSADFHHAGREGNYLKACVLFAAVTRKSPVGLTHVLPIDIDFGWPPETLAEADARKIQQAAWDAWREANE